MGQIQLPTMSVLVGTKDTTDHGLLRELSAEPNSFPDFVLS